MPDTPTFPFKATSIVKFKSPHASDLSFQKGVSLTVTGFYDAEHEWYMGEYQGVTGGFPVDFVGELLSLRYCLYGLLEMRAYE